MSARSTWRFCLSSRPNTARRNAAAHSWDVISSPTATLAFTRDMIDPATDRSSALERELFRRAATLVMQISDPRVCREVGLELIARSGAADHVSTVLVYHGILGVDSASWISAGVDIRQAIDREVYAGPRGRYEVRDFRGRVNAIRARIATGWLHGDRLVLVDRSAAKDDLRAHARKWLAGYVGELVLVDPGPWGLTDGGAMQICAALGIDAPGPQPRRVLGGDEGLF